MNAPQSYHRKHAGRNSNLPFIRYQTKGLEPSGEGTKGEAQYWNPAYRFYWAEHVSAMKDLTANASKVLAQIIRDQRQKGYCTRSVKHIGVACACSPRTVARALEAMRKDGSIVIHEWYRPRGRGRTASHIYVNWEHARWNGCAQREVSETSTENSQLTESMTAILAEDSLRENSRELSTAVSMTVEELTPTANTAEEKPQAEKVEETATATETTQRAVLGTLVELGVPARIAISDAAKAPIEALAVLAMVYRILNRGGIRNPAGLARAALRDPGRYLPSRAATVPECVPRARPAPVPYDACVERAVADDEARLDAAGFPPLGFPRMPPCWKCGLPVDPREESANGMHRHCDEGSRG